MERIRICDIARELGVSTATVSNVIHGKTEKVSPETFQRVQALLEERQYIPSMAGILLAQNSSRIIGVVFHDHEKYEGKPLEDPFFASSLNALSREIEKNGYFLMVKTARTTDEIITMASMWNMEGLVLLGFCEQDYQTLRDSMRIPFVIYDGNNEAPDRYYDLVLDDFDGGYQAGQYLSALGHKAVLCLSDNLEHLDLKRIRGFQAAFGETAVHLLPVVQSVRMKFYESILEELRHYSAAFVVSDFYAVELMGFLQSHGIRVPEEISVVGFDDAPISQWCTPMLTTIRQDGELRAKLAMEKLRQLRSGEARGGTVKIPVQLVIRESCTEYTEI